MSTFWLGLTRAADSMRQDDSAKPSGTGNLGPFRESTQELEDRLDKLALICMAMWSLMRQTTQLTEEDLMQRVKEIDLLDGQADGRITPQVARCPACNRVMSPRHTRCLYCGKDKLQITAFDSIG